MRQDQYELKGAVLEAPLEWQGLRLAPGRGGVLVTGLEGTDQRRGLPPPSPLERGAPPGGGPRGGHAPPPPAGGAPGPGGGGGPGPRRWARGPSPEIPPPPWLRRLDPRSAFRGCFGAFFGPFPWWAARE